MASKWFGLYFYPGADGAWTQTTKLTAADAAENDDFGIDVAISGDTVIVGARATMEAKTAVQPTFSSGRRHLDAIH